MTSKEFSAKFKPYYGMYCDKFDVVPCPRDYAASLDEFFSALLRAIEEGNPIDSYLKLKTKPSGKNIKI